MYSYSYVTICDYTAADFTLIKNMPMCHFVMSKLSLADIKPPRQSPAYVAHLTPKCHDPKTVHTEGRQCSMQLASCSATSATTLQVNPTQQDNIFSGQDQCMPMRLTT